MKNIKRIIEMDKMHEVEIVYKRPLYDEMPVIKSSRDAEQLIRKIVDTDRLDHKEFFWVLLLTRASGVLGISEIGKGDTSGVVVNLKEIFQLVIRTNASGIIVCHNHPSGKLEPSGADRTITRKINDFAKLISVNLIDHLIITSEGLYSFLDDGVL